MFPLGKYDLVDFKQSLSESLTPVTGGGDNLQEKRDAMAAIWRRLRETESYQLLAVTAILRTRLTQTDNR
ncbi:MAG: hypothetical protein VX435_08455 [Planctomycetota bacterium]|nr:hypothetical protein [Planctomycetota bacterium]